MLTPVAAIAPADAPLCGSKAFRLGELSARGYAVPAAVVVTTAGYRAFLEENRLVPLVEAREAESVEAGAPRLVAIASEIAAAFEEAPLPHGVRAGLDEWLRTAGAAGFAVRSSATSEDLPGASFAGQYTSFLDVAPADVPRAVVRCFASLFNARAALYRRRKGMPHAGAMAVIVQEMVPSDHAGVVFTRAPRRTGQLLVECAPGCGEDVVSGTVAPNRYYLNRSTLDVEEALEPSALDARDVRAAARAALAIERDLNGPQDVEYAVARGALSILQARPAVV